jgi:hypothetical protein
MKFLLAALSVLLLFSAGFSQKGWRDHEMEVRITISTPADASLLNTFHLAGDIHPSAGYALVYVVPAEFELLKESGLQAEILKNDLNDYYRDFWSGRAEQYHSYEQVIALMDSLAAAFPAICKKTSFGSTPQGRQLACLKISDNVSINENQPEVMFDGGIHGDEIGGAENLVRFARYLCTRYGSDPEVTGLVNSREITIYPMVNPDGRANMSRYNSNFVDCNRDWGYMWNGEGNSPGAFSQPETRAMRNCLDNHRFVIHVTYHSGMEAVLFPWGFRSAHAPGYTGLLSLASIYSASSGYTNLQYGQSYADYPTNGETIDYSYGACGTDALTMEISANKQPPASQIQNYYQKNVPAMIAMIQRAGYGIGGTVTDSISGLPVQASIFINNFFPVLTDSAVGDYHKYLPPGTYSIKVIANNYIPQFIDDILVGTGAAAVVNIQMHPAVGHYASKVSAVVIPGNNSADEGNTPGVLGAPDSIFYSTGKSGWIVMDMQDPVADIPGGDFVVHEGDDTPEGFTCLAGQTVDGPWISLGAGNGTTTFDLASSGLTGCRYLKIQDDGNGLPNVADAGFDLDAIEALSFPTGINPAAEHPGSLRVYPNPALETFTVEVQDKAINGTITICNALGIIMLTKEITGGVSRINIRRLPPGVYFVKFTGGSDMEVIKLIKDAIY